MQSDPHEQIFAELTKRWPYCTKHRGHCWINKGNSYDGLHYDFQSKEWGSWATHILNTKSVYDYPPRNEEFDQAIIAIDSRRKKGRGINNSNSSNNDVMTLLNSLDFLTNRNPSPQPPVIYQMPVSAPSTIVPSIRRLSDPGSPQKVRRQSTYRADTSLVDLLHQARYEREDFCDRALKDYLEWCQATYPGEYVSVVETLQKCNIGVDTFEDIDNPLGASEMCNIPYGTMLRILKNVRLWLTKKLATAIEY